MNEISVTTTVTTGDRHESQCTCGWVYAGARSQAFALQVAAEHLSSHARAVLTESEQSHV